MEVIPAEHLLFVLTDSMIHVCDISRVEANFAFIHSSIKTKGCSLFTLDVKVSQIDYYSQFTSARLTVLISVTRCT